MIEQTPNETWAVGAEATYCSSHSLEARAQYFVHKNELLGKNSITTSSATLVDYKNAVPLPSRVKNNKHGLTPWMLKRENEPAIQLNCVNTTQFS